MIDFKKQWPIIEDMLKREGVARQHLSSFNDFLEYGIQQIIDEQDDIDITKIDFPYKIRFGKVSLGKPVMMELDGSFTALTPSESRIRNVSYTAPINITIDILENDIVTESRQVCIGDMPVMIKSKACVLYNFSDKKLIDHNEDPNDPGGYFIINGTERVIMGLEDTSPNIIYTSKTKTDRKTTWKGKIHNNKSMFRSVLEVSNKEGGFIVVKVPNISTPIPVTILLRALGLKSDKDIVNTISHVEEIQDELTDTIDNFAEVSDVLSAQLYIGKRQSPGMFEELQLKKLEYTLDKMLLSHIGTDISKRKEKAIQICAAVNKMLELKLGWIEPDNRDDYSNKTVKFAGQLLSDLFDIAVKNLIRDMKHQLERSTQRRGINAVVSSIRTGIITDKLTKSISSGQWGKSTYSVTQALERVNYLSTISHLRRIQSTLSPTQSNPLARELNSTHFGRICPCETPEGANCGLVKNLALSAIVSRNIPTEDIIDLIYDLPGMTDVHTKDESIKESGTQVFLNGKLIGYCQDGNLVTNTLRDIRRKSRIHPHIGIVFRDNSNESVTKRMHINCNAGRILRPLIIVQDGKSKLTSDLITKVSEKQLSWYDLVRMGVMDLVGADEEGNCLVAIDKITKNHTHLEVFPPAMLGAGASMIVYPEHNQSPRNTYESAMAKQSLGFSTPMMNTSQQTRQHLMLYPQTPIVYTKPMSLLGLDDRPAGQNCIVAVLPYDGYNIEDAVVLSKSSVDRGLGRTFFYRVYHSEGKRYSNDGKDKFEIPNADDSLRGYRGEKYYRLLEEDGIISTEAIVKGGDVLIGKTSPSRFTSDYKDSTNDEPRTDTSTSMRPSEVGAVDTIIMTQSNQGYKMYKVRVRDMRVPEIGDKFASRHGQKGVIGILAQDEDLPYTKDGITPDVIINPHAFPSRMTVGMMMESISGKAAAIRGSRVDGTAFIGEKSEISDIMKDNGFSYSGKEIMYDGRTGKRFPVDIFIGVVYYQKLHHMVADKIHARARGQVQMLTKQPTEGRARGGGLRFGEMERDCLIAYGASMILKDRLMDESDKSEILLCERCGLVAHYDNIKRQHTCRVCGDRGITSKTNIAYAFKLLIQEMQSLNIAPRLVLKERV